MPMIDGKVSSARADDGQAVRILMLIIISIYCLSFSSYRFRTQQVSHCSYKFDLPLAATAGPWVDLLVG